MMHEHRRGRGSGGVRSDTMDGKYRDGGEVV